MPGSVASGTHCTFYYMTFSVVLVLLLMFTVDDVQDEWLQGGTV